MSKQWYKSTIAKEEVSNYPSEVFPGRIFVIQTHSEAIRATEYLKREPLLGFDTETKPARKKGEIHFISLIQISTEDTCFLFRPLKDAKILDEINEIFSNEEIIKIGLSLKDDFRGMRNLMKNFDPHNFIDLQAYVKQFGILDNGLSRIYVNLFNKRIAKSQRLSNWEADFLTREQRKYAALDAWATRRIYNELEEFRTNDEYIPKYDINQTINK